LPWKWKITQGSPQLPSKNGAVENVAYNTVLDTSNWLVVLVGIAGVTELAERLTALCPHRINVIFSRPYVLS
jgi:hypothetical protein